VREHQADAAIPAALRRYVDIDTPQRSLLEAAVGLAVRSFDCAVAVIALAGGDRVDPPALHAIAGYVGPAPQAGLYATATRASEGRMISHPRTLTNPVVARTLGFAFRVDLPLRSGSGDHLGMLTLLDRSPRSIDDAALDAMRALASGVVDVLEARLEQRAARGAITSGG
jgi:hypothetical protein